MPSHVLRTKVVYCDRAADVTVECELDIEPLLAGRVAGGAALRGQAHQAQRVLPDVDDRLERLGGLIRWRQRIRRLEVNRKLSRQIKRRNITFILANEKSS